MLLTVSQKIFFCLWKVIWEYHSIVKIFIVKKIENQLHFTSRPNKSSKANSSKFDISSFYLDASHHQSFWPYKASTTATIYIMIFLLIWPFRDCPCFAYDRIIYVFFFWRYWGPPLSVSSWPFSVYSHLLTMIF